MVVVRVLIKASIFFCALLPVIGNAHPSSLTRASTNGKVMVVTHRAPETDIDTRHHYEVAVLRLSLEKTRAEYGDYKMVEGPHTNVARVIHDMRHNTFPNHVFSLAYRDDMAQSYPELDFVRFPVYRGLKGFRTCFTSEQAKDQVAAVNTREQLLQLVHGQGRGWIDVDILRHAGFEVKDIALYDNLFKMVAAHRFHLFCRGANEIKDEYALFKHTEGLVHDQHLLLQYPLMHFFYRNKANSTLLKRINKGLQIAYADGSFKKLWKEKFQASIDFSELKKRKVFRFENPMIQSLDFDYAKYTYNPAKEP